MSAPPIVAVVGSTAAGKTSLSLDLAERWGGEVVNTDAMQVYRGMDIGTAKEPVEARRGIPHHLLDLMDVRENATVASFQELAHAAIDEIRGRGRTPVLVGGSGMYVRAVLDAFEFPGTDEAVRSELEAELAEHGSAHMHRLLVAADPQAGASILVANGRRIVRALEVIRLTGQPYSASLPQYEYRDPRTVQIGVDIDRPTLDARIEQRVEAMFEAGFVAEVERLVGEGLLEGRTAAVAIGYKEVLAHLRGEIDEAQARERTVFATRRFARKQDGWFRKDQRVRWVRFDAEDRVEQALRAVAALG